MPIINKSNYLYGASFADASVEIVLRLHGNISSEAGYPGDCAFAGEINLVGGIAPEILPAQDAAFSGLINLEGVSASEAGFAGDTIFGAAIDLAGELLPEAATPADSIFDAVLSLGAAAEPEVFEQFADSAFNSFLDLQGSLASEIFTPGVAPFPGKIRLGGNASAIALPLNVDGAFDGRFNLAGTFASNAISAAETIFDGKINLDGSFLPDTVLDLQNPDPITNSISSGAFANQRYAAGGGRLFINDVLTDFIRARINAPKGSLGKSLEIELARADLAQIPADGHFKFQTGKMVDGTPVWKTVLTGGRLEGRTYSMSVNRSVLSFSTSAGTEKLNRSPKNNLIVYDPLKTEVSTDEIEAIYTNTGEYIGANKSAINVLSLYKLLNIAFVTGCGFASVKTDIPNYEIARCDFTVTNTYAAAIKQFIGVFEPVFSIDADDKLIIQKTVNPLPEDYEPNEISIDYSPQFTETAEYPSSAIDGYILQYTARVGTTFVDRTEPSIVEPVGDAVFGDPDFVEQTTIRKYRDWYESGNPVAVRSELKQETIETRRAGETVGVETKINLFDALGRSKGYTNTLEARLPDVAADGVPAVLKTKEESQKITLGVNPYAPRQTIIKKIETTKKSLLAIDAENTALDKNGEDSPYVQDYEKVFDAGNLKTEMTSAFKTLETVTERFRPLPNGQVEVRPEKFDYLRGKPKPPITDVRSGDISVPNFTKQKTKTIFKSGITQENRTGKPLIPLNLGELPLFFAEPLADWLLANGRITGQIELAGFDDSVERGTSFRLRGIGDADLGRFLITGYAIDIEPRFLKTTLDLVKV